MAALLVAGSAPALAAAPAATAVVSAAGVRAAGDNLIENGDFEGYFRGWNTGSTPGAQQILDGGPTGKYLQVTPGGYVEQSVDVKPDTAYELMLNTATPQLSATVRLSGAGSSGSGSQEYRYDNREWKEHTVRFTTSPESTRVTLRLYSSSVGYFDDVRLAESLCGALKQPGRS
ncbi:hypothetical protein [Kitasatospora sp. NPDC094011]|uniref:hypothetical protein n=1 Tax=Kitasatospora sp. NPDC094011 TaxID=3364090 RepID=UPI00382FA083